MLLHYSPKRHGGRLPLTLPLHLQGRQRRGRKLNELILRNKKEKERIAPEIPIAAMKDPNQQKEMKNNKVKNFPVLRNPPILKIQNVYLDLCSFLTGKTHPQN